jgi:dihydroorotate dehydrogenase
LYKFFRSILFWLPAEFSHLLSLTLLKWFYKMPCQLNRALKKAPHKPVKVAGLVFKNPVGLAGGFDKNGDYIEALFALGFGFIELGTVTPLPQKGNSKPRLFRLVKQSALINRMGFNNKGVDYLVSRLQKLKHRCGVIGVNIGKNKSTLMENSASDYIICMNKVYPYADYITINISSPNTPGLRSLQLGDALSDLLSELDQARQKLIQSFNKRIPLFLKITVDLNDEDLIGIVSLIQQYHLDGIITSNTTLQRDAVATSRYAKQAGGLSGQPLSSRAERHMALLNDKTGVDVALIGVGGIMSSNEAIGRFSAGADLIQLYTGLIYSGPQLIRDILN